MSVGALVRRARVERAKAMLDEDAAALIMDVALESGFPAKSSFNAAFKEIVGMSPTEYRRARSGSRRG
jgi:AraC-like DNA-binding protein